MGSLNEMLQSARFMKFYTLEEHYIEQVGKIRDEELHNLRWMKSSVAAAWPLAATVPICMTAVIFGFQLLLNGELPNAQDTIAVLALCRFMYLPFAFFGGAMGGLNIFFAVAGRLNGPQCVHRRGSDFAGGLSTGSIAEVVDSASLHCTSV